MKMTGLLPLLAVCLFASCKLLQKQPVASSQAVTDELKELYYEAEAAYQANNTVEARDLFSKFVKKSPKPAAGYYRLACLDLKEGKRVAALDQITKARQADTSNYYYTLFEADLYKSSRQYARAAALYHQLAKRYTNHWSFFEDASKMYRNAGDQQNLVLLCNDWEKQFSLREDIVLIRSEANMGLKQYDAAVADWERLIQKYPYRRQYKISYATLLNRAGRPKEAAAVYQELIASDPENPELLSSLCQYYQDHGTKAEMWEHSKLVVKSTQMDLWKKHNCLLPFLNDANGNQYYDSLEQPLKQLAAMHGSDHRSWLFLADWYYARKQYPNAISGFEKTLELFSNDFQVWSKFVECLDRTARFTRMERVMDSMMELFPSNPLVYLMAAKAAIGNQNWKKAEELASAGMAFAVDTDITISLQLCWARILNLSGKKNDCYSMLESLKAQYPESAGISAEIANSYAHNNEKLESAVKLISDAVKMNPKNAEFLFIQGFVFYKNNQPDDAINSLQASNNLDTKGPTLELIGDIFMSKKDNLSAQKYWNDAWSIGYQSAALESKISQAKLNR